ncbi:MAG TPA: R2-like ligand-binding oxidase [Ktedonobacterales bacterium]|nr:R2-like ligand-binding oxidase [Ktedonobacterales bacterium]
MTTSATTHTSFATTSGQGLRHDILPMRLYHKAKKLGVWDPRDIDFSRDKRDWQGFSDLEKESILQLSALFMAGEESVTLDLLPLMMAIAEEGRLEEEMYLTTFLWEEAKHTEFFRRFVDEVAEERGDLTRYHTPSYRRLFYEELPTAMRALRTDRSPVALARASVTYNMIVEGVLAETGYHVYFDMLTTRNLLPGLRQGVGYLKRDESRHLAYGVFLLSRLVASEPSLWSCIEERMTELLPLALGVVQESDTLLEPDVPRPFGLRVEDYMDYAMSQFSKRLERISRARDQTLDQLYATSELEAGVE